jgi:hypothetical protein
MNSNALDLLRQYKEEQETTLAQLEKKVRGPARRPGASRSDPGAQPRRDPREAAGRGGAAARPEPRTRRARG